MKNWVFELLGFHSGGASSASPESGSLESIVEALESLGPDRAHFLAAFAFLLGRAAHADLRISADEVAKMEEIVRERGDLPPEQARLVVEIVRHEHHERGSTQSYLVAREFRRLASKDERRELLDCLFAVSAADDEISGREEKELRLVAEELGFSHREYVEVRSAYNDQRSVIRHLRGEA
jgi:uncharacterized tellurite resistance protein B-like protein